MRKVSFGTKVAIDIKAGIFSGINIDSESIETLIAGGIAFATPSLDENNDKTPDT